MPNHYKDVIEETAKASDEVQDTFKKKPILWWVLLIAAAVFSISLALYFYHFRNEFSDDQAVWGQFGDFMGGLVNPIVGLLTIGLLTVSLNQSNLALHQTAQALKQSEAALRQSGEEIRLAKQALLDNQKIQSATQDALNEQTAIAAQARDMNNAFALYGSLVTANSQLAEQLRMVGDLDGGLTRALQMNTMALSRLANILQMEEKRLLEVYGVAETRP